MKLFYLYTLVLLFASLSARADETVIMWTCTLETANGQYHGNQEEKGAARREAYEYCAADSRNEAGACDRAWYASLLDRKACEYVLGD